MVEAITFYEYVQEINFRYRPIHCTVITGKEQVLQITGTIAPFCPSVPVWWWGSMHNTKSLNLKQSPLTLLFRLHLCFFHCDMLKCLLLKMGPYLLNYWHLFPPSPPLKKPNLKTMKVEWSYNVVYCTNTPAY